MTGDQGLVDILTRLTLLARLFFEPLPPLHAGAKVLPHLLPPVSSFQPDWHIEGSRTVQSSAAMKGRLPRLLKINNHFHPNDVLFSAKGRMDIISSDISFFPALAIVIYAIYTHGFRTVGASYLIPYNDCQLPLSLDHLPATY